MFHNLNFVYPIKEYFRLTLELYIYIYISFDTFKFKCNSEILFNT